MFFKRIWRFVFNSSFNSIENTIYDAKKVSINYSSLLLWDDDKPKY